MYFGLNLQTKELTFLKGIGAKDALDFKEVYDIILFKIYYEDKFNVVHSKYVDHCGVRQYNTLTDLLTVESALAEAET